jgi:hypothetical protein
MTRTAARGSDHRFHPPWTVGYWYAARPEAERARLRIDDLCELAEQLRSFGRHRPGMIGGAGRAAPSKPLMYYPGTGLARNERVNTVIFFLARVSLLKGQIQRSTLDKFLEMWDGRYLVAAVRATVMAARRLGRLTLGISTSRRWEADLAAVGARRLVVCRAGPG